MPEFPTIAENERTPLVDVLLEISVWKDQRIDELEQEILKLKGETLKPKISPTKMDKEDEVDTASSENVTKPEKISKTKSLKIDERLLFILKISQQMRYLKAFEKWLSKILFSKPTTHVIAWHSTNVLMVITFRVKCQKALQVVIMAKS